MGTLIAQAASSAAQRQWRTLGTRSLEDARAWMVGVMRRQVSFAAAFAHARMRLARLERVGHLQSVMRVASPVGWAGCRRRLSPRPCGSGMGEGLWVVEAAVLARWVLASVELDLLCRARSLRGMGWDGGLGDGLEGGRLCWWWFVVVCWCLCVCVGLLPVF